MERLPTRLQGPAHLQPRVFRDGRGFFMETFREGVLADLGIDHRWVQDNHSRSTRGVLRGMHFAVGAGSAKLVRCARGAIYDVVVDLRRASPTFGQWEAFVLDDESLSVLYIPIGFAHGFCVTSEIADVIYKQSDYFDPGVEREIAFDDPDIAIAWPANVTPQVSERDLSAPRLRDVAADLTF